ncbi:hypothetical protein KUV95_11620 [Microbulbifer agarilyticus]|uniref:hypothetical protein n=1 Tax=Microbulbifer agarilyticus TaxID=260552 RepID=UPI001C968F2F|nr:hypothetical protein [Microbulbifer agarilyticus]MBY6212204.1 hypothetical protein [Microbulbifer agarilyticus]
MSGNAIATSSRQFEAQLTEVLGLMHTQADRLAQSLIELQTATHPWQSYLLQPGFAIEAAERLGVTFDTPFTLAAALFANLDYGEQHLPGDARNTLQTPGLLAAPAEIIALAQELNASKVEFQQLTATIKESLAPRPALERDRVLREMLGNAGFSRAHLRQCYRQILLCPERPDAVALSWIKTRKSVRKVSVDWCEKKLVQLDPQGQDQGIQYQRQLLAGLHKSQHDRLRQIQMQSRPNLQVAEIFRDKQEEYRQVGYAAMPVLVNSGGDRTLPEFTRVDHNPPLSQRRTRRDLRIEKTPFLAALRVHLANDSPN